MKKLIKLILLAAVVVGAVVGLMYIIAPDTEGPPTPDVDSATAKEWMAKINKLCSNGHWTTEGYNSISTGIHTDWKGSNGTLISKDEEIALQKYLFTASCSYLNKQVDALFKQSSYPDNKVRSAEDTLTFLKSKLDEFGSNSNLTEASNLLSEYHQLMGSFSFSSQASYSNPLKAYSGMSAEAAKARISGLKHYSSHFSKNPQIKSRVDNLAADRARAERKYYENLEKCVEQHYRSTEDLVRLLDDQERFNYISTNPGAKSKLNSYVNNSDRK